MPSWRLSLGLLALLLLVPATSRAQDFAAALERLEAHYAERFPGASFTPAPVAVDGCGEVLALQSDRLRRPATGPLVFDHGDVRPDAVVLFHGLSDSPWFMCGIARRLFDGGANVVIALATGQGRVDPWPEVHRDDLIEAWKADGLAALAFAQSRGTRVSVGGMSLGGVIAVRTWTLQPDAVNGGIMLFSAAFDFPAALRVAAGCIGTAAERAPWTAMLHRWCGDVLTGLTRWREQDVPWTAGNPYRNFFSSYGALMLGVLRRETLAALETRPLDAPLLVVHSLADTVSPIAGVDRLVAGHRRPELVVRLSIDDVRRANCRKLESDCMRPAPVLAACGVPHASLTLPTPILQEGSGFTCEVANPEFGLVAEAAAAFIAGLASESEP